MKYDELNIRDRAAVIKAAVSHGARSLQDVRNQWNTFAEGGQESTPVRVNTNTQMANGQVQTTTFGNIGDNQTYIYNNQNGQNSWSEATVITPNFVNVQSGKNAHTYYKDNNPEQYNWQVERLNGLRNSNHSVGALLPEFTVTASKRFDEGGQEDTTDAAMQVITNNRNKLDRKYDFIVDTWDSEFNGKPKGYNEETGLYFPYKSAEGGMPTVGPGLKVRPNGKGDAYSFTESEVANGVTKAQIDEKLGNNSELQYEKVLEFLNQKGNRLPTDTISPSIMRGLMDLRYQTGSLGSFNNLREAVLNGDLKGIKKESRVFYKNNGKNVLDKRRNQHRAERFWHYDNGGNLFSTGGVVYPFSFNGNIPPVRY